MTPENDAVLGHGTMTTSTLRLKAREALATLVLAAGAEPEVRQSGAAAALSRASMRRLRLTLAELDKRAEAEA